MPETTEALVREGDPELERPVRPASLSFSKSLPLPLRGIVASTFALTAAVRLGRLFTALEFLPRGSVGAEVYPPREHLFLTFAKALYGQELAFSKLM